MLQSGLTPPQTKMTQNARNTEVSSTSRPSWGRSFRWEWTRWPGQHGHHVGLGLHLPLLDAAQDHGRQPDGDRGQDRTKKQSQEAMKGTDEVKEKEKRGRLVQGAAKRLVSSFILKQCLFVKMFINSKKNVKIQQFLFKSVRLIY